MTPNNSPIGIFDSGIGGLTVLKAIRDLLPGENLVYLGDTARLPYGTKSARSVLRYASQAAAHLQQRNIKMLVIACNTASAVAVSHLIRELAPLPVIGVVEPGASAAVDAVPRGRHLVLATEATVALGAYGDAVRRLDKDATVLEVACEILVALAEEGWTEGDVVDGIIHRYLSPFLSLPESERPHNIILGCTHFPILSAAIAAVAGPGISIVDSASTTARFVAIYLSEHNLSRASENGSIQLLATDGTRRFARVGGAFLDTSLSADDIDLVDL